MMAFRKLFKLVMHKCKANNLTLQVLGKQSDMIGADRNTIPLYPTEHAANALRQNMAMPSDYF